MPLKFTKEQVRGTLRQASGGKPFFKVEKALKEAGLGKFLHQPSVSKDQFRKMVGALREEGVVRKQAGEVIRTAERRIAAETRPGEKPKEKITLAELRKQREEEEKKKEEMRKRMASIYGRERALEEEEAERKGTVQRNVLTSALKPKAAPGRPETTTSALRKPEPKSAKEEKPPQAVDLAID